MEHKTALTVALVLVFGPVWLYIVFRLCSAAALRSWVDALRRGTGSGAKRKETK